MNESTPQPSVCVAVIIPVVIIGLAHYWFVAIHFSRLGYGEGDTDCKVVRRTRKSRTRSHAASSMRAGEMAAMSALAITAALSHDNVVRALEEGSADPKMLQLATSVSTYYTPVSFTELLRSDFSNLMLCISLPLQPPSNLGMLSP